MRHRLTIIKDARTPAWGLQFLKHPSRDLCHILHCTGTGCHLIVRSEPRTFCMDFITNTHGKTVPHDGGRGFCGAQELQGTYCERSVFCRSIASLLVNTLIRKCRILYCSESKDVMPTRV